MRRWIRLEYAEGAEQPDLGFHFPIGRPLTALLG
jgi:hypothetical protein